MAKKINAIREEKLEAKRKVEELEKLEREAQQKVQELEILEQEAQNEELLAVKNIEDSINAIAANNNMFCGVILTRDDLLAVFDLALKTNENIKIPFRLYYNE